MYVGPSLYPLGRMIMCHMVADSLDELHKMANLIGLKRQWFQADGVRPHYDISMSKRALAIQLGALSVSEHKIIEIVRILKIKELEK